MSIRRLRWAAPLGVLLLFAGARGQAQQTAWRPARMVVSPAPAAAPDPVTPAAALGRPVAAEETAALPPLPLPSGLVPVSHTETESWQGSTSAYQPPEPPPGGGAPPPPPPPPGPPPTYNSNEIGAPLGPGGGGGIPGFWGKCCEWAGIKNKFRSDHCFDYMPSPLSNPFHFEDPRALTEVRPIFIYQASPRRNPVFDPGHSYFLGAQARVAFNDRWSLVFDKFGLVSFHPDIAGEDSRTHTDGAGFDFGPKWTFFRNENTGTVVATGLTFEVPPSNRTLQNSGAIGFDPYLTVGQNFGRLPQGFGSFNFLGEMGYSFSTGSKQAEYLHTSLHLDYDVLGQHKLYPLVELNWFYFARQGSGTPGFAGGDVVTYNVVGGTQTRNYWDMALGARYKFCEWAQTGVAVDFPLSSQSRNASGYRITFDLIFRY